MFQTARRVYPTFALGYSYVAISMTKVSTSRLTKKTKVKVAGAYSGVPLLSLHFD